MVGLYIIYGLLIVAAVAILPLRIRARRRTLREIDALRSTFHSNMEDLLARLETTTKPKPDVHALSIAHGIFDRFSVGVLGSRSPYVLIEQLMQRKPHRKYVYQLVSLGRAWQDWPEFEYEEQDVWDIVAISKKTPQTSRPHEDALAAA